jgi:16S rRNA (adenine1518-N6/adenine1519-N6)-dimethyltransferase
MHSVTLLHADALHNKNRINPDVLAAVAKAIKDIGADGYHLVANLPYDVAASVVGNLLVDDLPIRSLTITVQYEVGERMNAAVGSKEYGPLSVLIQQVGKVQWVRTLGPAVFWPQPKVNSCILRIEVDQAKREPLAELRTWHRFVRDLFMHRRKTLRSAIASIPGYKQFKNRLDPIIAAVGLTPEIRAEQIPHSKLFDLYREIAKVSLGEGQEVP